MKKTKRTKNNSKKRNQKKSNDLNLNIVRLIIEILRFFIEFFFWGLISARLRRSLRRSYPISFGLPPPPSNKCEAFTVSRPEKTAGRGGLWVVASFFLDFFVLFDQAKRTYSNPPSGANLKLLLARACSSCLPVTRSINYPFHSNEININNKNTWFNTVTDLPPVGLNLVGLPTRSLTTSFPFKCVAFREPARKNGGKR